MTEEDWRAWTTVALLSTLGETEKKDLYIKNVEKEISKECEWNYVKQ